MEIAINQSKAALFLIFAMAVSIVALPAAQETLGKKQKRANNFLLLFSGSHRHGEGLRGLEEKTQQQQSCFTKLHFIYSNDSNSFKGSAKALSRFAIGR